MGLGNLGALLAAALVTLAGASAAADPLTVTGGVTCIPTPPAGTSFADGDFTAPGAVVFEEHPPYVVGAWFPFDWFVPGLYTDFDGAALKSLLGDRPFQSYLVHFDPLEPSTTGSVGTIRFPSSIAAVMARGTTLTATDGYWGVGGASYGSGPERGLETGEDTLSWTASGVVDIDLHEMGGLDQIRVLVNVGPDPARDAGIGTLPDAGASADAGGTMRTDAGGTPPPDPNAFSYRGGGGCTCRATRETTTGAGALAALPVLALALGHRLGFRKGRTARAACRRTRACRRGRGNPAARRERQALNHD